MIRKLFLAFFFLLILSINFNGPDFLYTRELFFFLLLFFVSKYSTPRRLSLLFYFGIFYFFCLSINLVFNNEHLEILSGLYYFLGFMYLFLYVFENEINYNQIIKYYLISSSLVAVLIISIWLIAFFNDEYRNLMINYFENVENSKVAFILMIRERKFLDWWIPGVYYGTAPCLIPSLGFMLNRSLKSNFWKYNILIILHVSALLFTASRANILSVGLILLFFIVLKFLQKKHYLYASLLTITVVLSAFQLIISLLGDKDEGSLEVKDLHFQSYMNLFETNYFRTIFFGWGPGSEFYTLAYNNFTKITELSYFEAFRRYGVIPSIIFILLIWYKPFLNSTKLGFNGYLITISMLTYLFVAGTNPYLFGSIGFLAAIFYSSVIRDEKFKLLNEK